VFIARLTASHQRNAAGHRHLPSPPSIDMLGGNIAAVCFRHR
jgi:hypothetical protein